MRRSLPVLTAATLVAFTGCGATVASTSHSSPAALTASATPAAVSGSSKLTTTGTGTVTVRPDVMTAQIGVENSASRVSGALNANNAISAAVQKALERNGVPVADIQTVELYVYAQTRKGVTTYRASDVVDASLHNLKKAGAILDAALAAAGNAGRLDGVSFSVGSEAPSLAQARKRAIASARTDAEQLAAAGGLTLVGLRSVTDQTDQYQGDSGEAASASGGTSGTSGYVPLQAGTQQIIVEVTAVWAARG
jgi:uncharacterized protein YggE